MLCRTDSSRGMIGKRCTMKTEGVQDGAWRAVFHVLVSTSCVLKGVQWRAFQGRGARAVSIAVYWR